MDVVVEGLAFPEGPRWHDGRLWWSDMHADQVQSWAPGEAPRTELSVSGRPSGLGWLPDGRLLAVSMTDRAVLKREADGSVSTHCALEASIKRRANDMVVDAGGRAYVGNFGFDFELGEAITPTVLMLVEADGAARPVADDLVFPNGMCITPDGACLIVAETFAARLTAFDILPDGGLRNRRVWAQLERDAVPDGICLDAEGAVWIASPTANACLRVREGGEIAERIETGRPAYACMLGGADGRQLFICTADTHDRASCRDARAGRIERVEVNTAGAG